MSQRTGGPGPAPRPDVSVIVPCYNAAGTLPATLASLRAQAFARWEAICVDDASSDNTAELLAAAAREDARFRPVSVPHGGVAAARNAGVALARAGHVLFLDSDDVLRPEALAVLWQAARGGSAQAVVAGGYEVLDQAGEPLGAFYFPPQAPLTVESLLGGNSLPPTTLVPRALLGRAPFRPELPTCEDWDLWLRLAQGGATRTVVPAVIYGFRLRRGSLTHGADRLHTAGRQVLDHWRRFVRDGQLVQAAYHRLGWQCGAVALASGAPDALARYLRDLPPVPLTGEFARYVASCVHSAFQFVRGAEGQTWRTHRAAWLREAREWLATTPLGDEVEALLEEEPPFALDPSERFAAVRAFLERQGGEARVVLYGLGFNGHVLLELLRADGVVARERLCVADDFATPAQLATAGLPADDPHGWQNWPAKTVVIVTPNTSDVMRATLRRAGGREGIDFLTLIRGADRPAADLVEALHA